MKIKADINYNETLLDDSGYINRSNGEFVIAQFLIKNNIEYKRDVVISKTPEIDGKYNCDFVFYGKNKEKYWLEFWGLEGCNYFDYDKTKSKKIKLYKKYKLNLIQIHSKDYFKNSYDDFINILENKIKEVI